jgi:hypothetical protein
MGRHSPLPRTKAQLEAKVSERVIGHGDTIHIGVIGKKSRGIQIDVSLGSDDQSVYLEAYHWFGQKQPIRIVSSVSGEPIDTGQPDNRPHPELAIVEVPA